MPHIFAANGLDHIIWRRAKQIRNDRELVHMVLAWEKRLALKHLCKDAACAPDINLHIVLLPREHNLGRAVVSGRDITGHLRVLNTGETKVADFQIAVFVDENVAGLEIAMDDTGRVNIFQSTLSQVSSGFLPAVLFLCHTRI